METQKEPKRDVARPIGVDDAKDLAVSITSENLATVAKLITMRFPTSSAEATRVARMRRLVSVTAELTHKLTTYSRHALVHCQGTPGNSDLCADTTALDRALREFSLEIQRVAEEYAHVAEPRGGIGRDHKMGRLPS